MSTQRRGRKPDVGLRHDPHAWIWYLLAGAAVDDIFDGAKLLWGAAVAAFFTMLATFIASVLAITALFHLRLWVFRWVPSMDLLHSVRMGLVLSAFLFIWAWLHMLRAIFRGIAPKTYKKAAITLRYSANLAMVTPIIMFTKATWRTDGANFFASMNAALDDPENEGLNKSKLAQEREAATWDLRRVDWDDMDAARAHALRIVRSALTAAWMERGLQSVGVSGEPRVPTLPRAVKWGALTDQGVAVHLKWPAGGTYKRFESRSGSTGGGVEEQLKSFWHLPHRENAIVWDPTNHEDATEVTLYLNYHDALPEKEDRPGFDEGDNDNG